MSFFLHSCFRPLRILLVCFPFLFDFTPPLALKVFPDPRYAVHSFSVANLDLSEISTFAHSSPFPLPFLPPPPPLLCCSIPLLLMWVRDLFRLSLRIPHVSGNFHFSAFPVVALPPRSLSAPIRAIPQETDMTYCVTQVRLPYPALQPQSCVPPEPPPILPHVSC